MRTRTMRTAVLAVAAAVAGTACGGPQPTRHYGAKTVPISVSFGKLPADDPRAPEGTTALEVAPAGIGVLTIGVPAGGAPRTGEAVAPTAPDATPPPAPRLACPDYGPFDFSRDEPVNQVRTTAPKGTYPYRVRTLLKQDGTTSTSSGVVDHTVGNTRDNGDGTYAFDVTSTVADVRTTLSFVATKPLEVGSTGQVGLAGASSKPRTGPEARFSFAKPLKLLQLRPNPGDTWRDAASDPVSATTYTIEARVVGKAPVNACGARIDTWHVQATQRVVTPNQDITSTRDLWIATQYGGLVVQDVVAFSGRAGTVPVSGETAMTINRDPGA